jgi:23S rRNA-/tRNA-specific pseudouridylate synthase
MSELLHPVAGDKKYGAKTNPLGRLGLHANLLEIIHPVTKNKLVLKAKADNKFRLPKTVKKS